MIPRERAFWLTGSILLVGVVAAALSGCSVATRTKAGPPDWVVRGNGAFKEENGAKTFYGVGAVAGVRNLPLARTAAENRARAEIGKVFETYSASLMKDYMASTTGGAAVTSTAATTEEQHIEQAIKTFSAATLSGVMIIDHWTDPADGTLYALARLDMDNFKNSLDKMQALNAGVRDFVRKNAEKTFDALAAEEEKRAK